MSNEMKDYMNETNQEMLRAANNLRGLYPIGVSKMNGEFKSTVLVLDPEVDGNGLKLNARLDELATRKVTDEEREKPRGKHPKDLIFIGSSRRPHKMFRVSATGNDVLLNTYLAADDYFLHGVDKEILEHIKLSNDRTYFPDEVEKLEQLLGAAGLKRVPLEQVKGTSLSKPLKNTPLNDLSLLARNATFEWGLEASAALEGMYPLGVVASDTADDPLRVAVLELDAEVDVPKGMVKINPKYTLFRPFTLDERDAREYQNISCHGIDVESDSGQVWVLDDVTACSVCGPDVLNRISTLADTLCPGINYGVLNRIRVPNDGLVTPDKAEELLDDLTRAGVQKADPGVEWQGRHDCIWNTLHTSLNAAMDFYEEAVRAAGRGEER